MTSIANKTTDSTETAIMETRHGFLSLADTDFTGMVSEELDGLSLTFDRIKMPGAGGAQYIMPGEEDDLETVKEFSAVILYHHPMLCYYKNDYNGGNAPPDCGSLDGEVGVGDPGGQCATCPLNQFGSGKNGSKACKNKRRLYLLREGEVFPLLMSLPTGSLGSFTQYIKRLLAKGRKANSVVTRFSLKKVKSKGGIDYAQAQFSVDRPLTPEEYTLIVPLAAQVKTYSQRVALDGDAAIEETKDYIDLETGEVLRPLGG